MQVELHPTDEDFLLLDGHPIKIGHFTGETIRDRLLLAAGRTPHDERPTQRWSTRDAYGNAIIPPGTPVTKLPKKSPKISAPPARTLTGTELLEAILKNPDLFKEGETDAA